ncbi:MAG: glycosyltransferase family 2 protein [Gammaproteobacteria bacterium]|nr:glycosyltransferase family 2 protein [Gammaproteobacteria bacterium]
MRLSCIIPVLNEAAFLSRYTDYLASLKVGSHELIIVDGGSQDRSASLGRCIADRFTSTHRGRAHQMNAGAALATGDVLVFLHVDTLLPATAIEDIITATTEKESLWGGFDVRLSGHHPAFRMIETLMNLRSRLTGILTGDQTLFIRRDLFHVIGGFPNIPLMEDIAISRRLKRRARPAHITARVLTSSRRWEHQGILRTIIKMWLLRLAYFLGVDPNILVHYYYGKRG